jgi:type IV secretory pathway VirB2 component (pilin)
MDAALVESDARSRQLAADGLAVLAIVLAGLTGVVTFLPAQGYIGAPLHDGLSALLGRLTFALPLVLLLGGVVRLLHVTVPAARLTGLALLLVGVVAAEHLVSAGDAGLAGRWLATALREAVGDVAAALLVLATLALGGMLTFGVRLGWR